MLTAIYARVSTEESAEKGFSIPSQLEACRRRAAEIGAINIVEYVDDGYSGGDLDRPAMNELRNDVKLGKISTVIFYDPDRFARNLMHQLIVTEEIEKAGCRLEFVNFEWKNTPEGRLFYSLRGAISEYEREKIKERTMRGKLEKARQGKVVVPQRTIGLIWDKEREVYFKDPEKAKVVQDIFEMMAYEKMTTRQIAERLNSLDIPAPSVGTRKNKNNGWTKKTVGCIIKNPVYIGEYYYNRYRHVKKENKYGKKVRTIIERPREEWIAIPVEPIIDRELWERANKQLQINGRLSHRVKRFYLLRGMLKCAKCGNNFGATTGSAGRHYKCYGTTSDGKKVCNAGMLNADKTEAVIWDAVKEALKDPERILKAVEREQKGFEIDRKKAETRLTSVEHELQMIEDKKQQILSLFRANLLTQEDVAKELAILKKKADILMGEKVKAERVVKVHQISKQNAEIIRNICSEVAANIDHLDDHQKREILEIFIEEITVTVEKTNSPNSPKVFEIKGLLPINKLHTDTSLVGEVPHTYFNLDLGERAKGIIKEPD